MKCVKVGFLVLGSSIFVVVISVLMCFKLIMMVCLWFSIVDGYESNGLSILSLCVGSFVCVIIVCFFVFFICVGFDVGIINYFWLVVVVVVFVFCFFMLLLFMFIVCGFIVYCLELGFWFCGGGGGNLELWL